MSRSIIGVTVGTAISPVGMERKLKPVKTVNGTAPDENGNVEVAGGGYTLTEEDKAEIVSAVIDALPVYDGEVL